MQKPKLVYTTYHSHHAEKLWAAITKPEFTRQYWAGLAQRLRLEERFDMAARDQGEKPEVWITGKVLECIPPKRLVLTWADPDDLADKSRVTFEIEAIKDMVCLTVTHGNFKAGSTMAGKVSWGWPRVLSSMKSFLETGKGLNVFAR